MREFIWHYFLTILITDNTLPGFHSKYTHFTQNVVVFGYHRYNIWRHQRQKGKPFKSRKVIFSPKVNNNQIQKIGMEPGRYKF